MTLVFNLLAWSPEQGARSAELRFATEPRVGRWRDQGCNATKSERREDCRSIEGLGRLRRPWLKEPSRGL
jgi:hypothetical protein